MGEVVYDLGGVIIEHQFDENGMHRLSVDGRHAERNKGWAKHAEPCFFMPDEKDDAYGYMGLSPKYNGYHRGIDDQGGVFRIIKIDRDEEDF